MNLRKCLAIFLCMAMISGILSGCGNPVTEGSQAPAESVQQDDNQGEETVKTNDEEIQKAVDLGIVTRDYAAELDTQVTYAEFAAMLDAVTSAAAPERQATWEDLSQALRDGDEPMNRGAGAQALFTCAMALEIDGEGYDMGAFWLEETIPDGMDYWDGMPWDDPHLPNMADAYVTDAYEGTAWAWLTDYPIYNNAGWFVRRYSYGNGKCYMEYDENSSFRWGEPFTREEAIHAAQRLYETAVYCQFIPADQVVCGVTKETFRLAQDMRPASYDALPDWKGYTITSPYDGFGVGECGYHFYQEEVERIADMGFDFVRVTLDFRSVFGDEKTTDMVRTRFVASMDDLINWCAARGIHVCFDIHQAPGFNTGGDDSGITIFENEEEQELFARFWGWMAEHYQQVPSSLLSFNLMNEPHTAEELTDEAYSSVMLKAIDRIRAYTPDRLIFADMLGVSRGRPVEGLAGARVAQSVHPYVLAPGAQRWPDNTINGFVHRDNGTLTIDGNFPAGTTITAQIAMAHLTSELTWAADSAELEPFYVGGEAVGEGGCVQILEAGTGGECRSYANKEWNVTLAEDCGRLTLRQKGEGIWYMVRQISIETPLGVLYINGNQNFVTSDKVPHLTLMPDGSVQAAVPDTFLSMDKAFVDAMFQEYAAFTARTGEAVMIQEFGASADIADQAACGMVEDLLSLADQYGIPWCSFNSVFGLWVSEQEIDYLSHNGRQALRDGADYEHLGNGWVIDRGMEKIFRSHM